MDFPTLRQGDRGAWVALLQKGLARLGFLPPPPDGIFGGETRRGVLAFQEALGLTRDGIAGPQVWGALRPGLTGFVVHRIAPGDTMYRLGQQYGSGTAAILRANPGVEPGQLRPGAALTVPLPFPVVPTDIPFGPAALALTVEGLRARYPEISVETIGASVLGTAIPALRLGSGPRRMLVNAAHHANEWITAPLVLRWFEERAAAGLPEGVSLTLVPMVNPDGVSLVTGELNSGPAYAGARRIAARYPAIPFPAGWKANIAGVDPNLQYPAGWEEARKIKFAQGYTTPAPRDYVGRAPLEAPESRALYDLALREDFALSLSWHTQGEVIYWRYLGYAPPGAEALGRRMAQVSGYALDDAPEVSGYAGFKDWFILGFDRPGYTLEAGLGTNPLPIADFPKIYPPVRAILEAAILGI